MEVHFALVFAMKSGLSGVLETVLGDVGDKFGDVGQSWVNVVKFWAVCWKQEAESNAKFVIPDEQLRWFILDI